MSMLIECVPNFSEGRDKARVDAIVAAMLRAGVYHLAIEKVDACAQHGGDNGIHTRLVTAFGKVRHTLDQHGHALALRCTPHLPEAGKCGPPSSDMGAAAARHSHQL